VRTAHIQGMKPAQRGTTGQVNFPHRSHASHSRALEDALVRSRRLVLLLAVVSAVSLAAPATASSVAPAVPDGAIPLEGGGYALELSAPTPAWYTDELHAQVIAAGAQGVPIPDEADIPASALAWTGIRPGAWMIFPAWCTMNFVFGGSSAATAELESEASAGKTNNGKSDGNTKANNGQGNGKNGNGSGGGGAGSGWYIGTAGHCTDVGEEVTLIAAPGVLMNIGRTVRSYNDEIGKDFALVEIYPDMVQYINPSMAIVGGPQGVAQPAIGDPVLHTGHGAAVGTGGTPRAGVVAYTGDGDHNFNSAYGWVGAATPGDSGSGVRHVGGAAVGNLTHLVVGTEYAPAYIAGTTAPYMEQLAGVPICYGEIVASPLPSPVCAS
jgi:hypothetical protein